MQLPWPPGIHRDAQSSLRSSTKHLPARRPGLRMDRIDMELLGPSVHPRVHAAEEPVPPEDREHIGPEFPFVFRQEVFVDIVEPEQSARSFSDGKEVVEGS